MTRRLIASLLLAAACYENPEDIKAEHIIRIVDAATDLYADEYSSAPVEVVLSSQASTSKQVTVTCSTGRINPSAPAGDTAERSITRNISPSGRLSFTYVAGRTPGKVRIEATTEGQSASVEYDLQQASPQVIELEPSKLRLEPDGSDRTVVKVIAYRERGLPSNGLRVSLRSCCDENGGPVDCAGPPPLRIPGSLFLDAQTQSSFDAIADYHDPGDAFSVNAWIVAVVGPPEMATSSVACSLADQPESSVRAQTLIIVENDASDAGVTDAGGDE